MSYSEENGQVVLRMSREDYERVLMLFGMATAVPTRLAGSVFTVDRILALLNRLNQGNPNYRPYEVTEKS